MVSLTMSKENTIAASRHQLDSSFWFSTFLFVCMAVLFLAAYAETINELWYYWIAGSTWQFLIPVAFVYMLWDGKHRYIHLEIDPSLFWGGFFLFVTCGLLIIGQLSSTHSLREISIVLSIFALALLLFGAVYVRSLFWPLAYLVLMTSLPLDLLEVLRTPLKLISATVSTEILRFMGFVIYRDVTLLYLPHITLEVADECSGVNQLVSAVALGIPIAYTFLSTFWKRVFIISLSIFFGLLMNWVRVVLISIWHYDSAKPEIHGPQGIYELPFIFLVGVFLTIMVAQFISDEKTFVPKTTEALVKGTDSHRSSGVGYIPASLIAIAVLSVTVLYLKLWTIAPVPLKDGFTKIPTSISSFMGSPISGLKKPFHTGLAHDEMIREYVDDEGRKAQVYVGYFQSQNQEKELIDYRYNWLHEGANTVDISDSSSSIQMKKRLLVSGKDTKTIFFTYEINGKSVTDQSKVKILSLMNALLDQRTNGAIIVVAFEGDIGKLSNNQEEFLNEIIHEVRAITF